MGGEETRQHVLYWQEPGLAFFSSVSVPLTRLLAAPGPVVCSALRLSAVPASLGTQEASGELARLT